MADQWSPRVNLKYAATVRSFITGTIKQYLNQETKYQ